MTAPGRPYRPEFEAALRAFARASEAMRRQGLMAPVLVGGAAVEHYSGSAITIHEETLGEHGIASLKT